MGTSVSPWIEVKNFFGSALGRGLHSLTLELNLSNSRKHSRVKLGDIVDRIAQVERKWERVQAPGAGVPSEEDAFAVREVPPPARQGLTLVHFSAQRTHILLDTSGA